MADLKHVNGSVITGVPDDEVERYLGFDWELVGGDPASDAADPAPEPVEAPAPEPDVAPTPKSGRAAK